MGKKSIYSIATSGINGYEVQNLTRGRRVKVFNKKTREQNYKDANRYLKQLKKEQRAR